jgi:histidinol phosphatase-like enzyme
MESTVKDALYNLNLLPKTWFLDLDGTILEHGGYLNDTEQLLPGVRDFFNQIPAWDQVVLVTARHPEYREKTLSFLKQQGIRFDHAIFDLPVGERILINDRKPSGLTTAYSINLDRNAGLL